MFADVGNVPAVLQTSHGEDKSGLGGGSWMFALVIIFFALVFLGGGTGLGGNRGSNDISNAGGAAFTELNGRLNALEGQISHNNDLAELRALYTQACATDMNVTQQAFNVSNLINQTRTDTLLNFKDAALQMANCCCETQRAIDGVNYNNSKNTCDIIAAGNANTQRIIDQLTQTEITSLRDKLAEANLAASQCAQTAAIINTVRPYPNPAFTVAPPCSPVTPFYGPTPFGSYPFRDGCAC